MEGAVIDVPARLHRQRRDGQLRAAALPGQRRTRWPPMPAGRLDRRCQPHPGRRARPRGVAYITELTDGWYAVTSSGRSASACGSILLSSATSGTNGNSTAQARAFLVGPAAPTALGFVDATIRRIGAERGHCEWRRGAAGRRGQALQSHFLAIRVRGRGQRRRASRRRVRCCLRVAGVSGRHPERRAWATPAVEDAAGYARLVLHPSTTPAKSSGLRSGCSAAVEWSSEKYAILLTNLHTRAKLTVVGAHRRHDG